MFVDLSRHANISPIFYNLHMLIIFAQALMDDLNSRENWNIQDWMYYAQHTDKSAQSRLTIVVFCSPLIFKIHSKKRHRKVVVFVSAISLNFCLIKDLIGSK